MKRSNDKRLKYFDMSDRDLLGLIVSELDVRGASRAYIEVIRTDLINALVAEEHSTKGRKRNLLQVIGGDVEKCVEKIMSVALLRGKGQNWLMEVGDAFFTYIFILAISITSMGIGNYYFYLGPGILTILSLSFLFVLIITRNSGRNAKDEDSRRKDAGGYKLAIILLTGLASFFANHFFHLPMPWAINGWIPILLAILCWLSCYSWDSKINDDILTHIQNNYE
ncbi:hypothetical protein ACGCUP_03480 [Eubacteriales bacterium KG125]